ncbi:MAG: hypothetical protein COZ57_14295 [Armatimonadetes bacterium CG_4_8_14_3_um_filter_66_20]|nr:MAG: hypothetical protein COZ57_14295 [Armatimonadetes bacterium CG_4_8_14_3_um_filter_66_20]
MSRLLLLLTACLAMPVGADTVAVDDFSSLDLSRWQSSTTPEYYRGGQGRQGLTVATDGGKKVLRAAFGFGDPKASEPIWVTRQLDPPVSRLPIRTVRFRYRWEVAEPAGAKTAPVCVGGFKVRLRTSPTSFTDFDVPTVNGSYPVGRWVDAAMDVYALNSKVRNVYGVILGGGADLGKVEQFTFRLDDVDDLNARGALWVSDIAFEVEPDAQESPYTPQVLERHPDKRLDLLNICHNGDGFYDFDKAALLLDGKANIVTSSFHGLHFPIWDFPKTREALLRFDVIVLGDVDPWVFTAEQLHWIADAVHSGVGLLACTGPQSFGNARKHPKAFTDLLPVTYEPGAKQQRANATPARAADHVLTAGCDPAVFGTVREVNGIAPRADATLLLTAGKQPLLVAGQTGPGRVLVLNGWAQPSALGDGSFMTNAAWQPFAARLLAWLANRKLPAAPAANKPPAMTRIEARWLYGKSAFAPGSPFGFEITVHRPAGTLDAEVTATLSAPSGTLWTGKVQAAAEARIEGTLPNVASGPVTATLTMPGAERVTLQGQVVDPLRRDDFYPIITYLPTMDGGHVFDFERTDDLVREVYDHGFNTIAVGGLGANAGGGIAAALRGRAEATAGSLGMASILEYTTFTEYSRDRPHRVSPFADEFEATLRKRVEAGIEQARYVPRLLSVKYVDEPFMTPACLDDSDATKAAFHELTGHAYMDRKSLGDDAPAKYAFGRFLSAYLEKDFAVGQKIKTDEGAPWDLLQTYCSPGFGSGRALDGFEDVYRWTRPADRFDFDVYPYFYPTSDRIRFVQANWCFAESRVISRALSKPWGFYVELDDRNYPYQVNPAEASAECAYTAVAAGADYLNSFILRTFGSGNTARPERWEKCGEALRAIRRIGPLLTRWQRQPARVGVLLPETQQLLYNGYNVPMYTLSILAQAVGDADVIHEEILTEGLPGSLEVLFVIGADALRRDAQQKLIEWVRQGGAVVFDGLPTVDEHGQALEWPAEFTGDRQGVPFGNGRVGGTEEGIEDVCRNAVEGDDPRAWPKLVAETARDVLPLLRRTEGSVGVRVTANALHTDVGVRGNMDSACVLIVNHHADAQPVAVELSDWGFRPGWVVDLTTDQTIGEAVSGGGAVTLKQTLPGRGARVVGIYEKRPTKVAVGVATGEVKRGEALRYTVAMQAAAAPAKGSFLLNLAVVGPEGSRYDRLGGARATEGGVCAVEALVPISAPTGRYTITATAPHAGLAGEATFVVR